MFKQLLANTQEFLMTGLLLVGLYLVATNGSAFNTFAKTGFSGVTTIFKTLQGR
jgi:hypothetical protein